jgi:hypothetical protein
MLGKCKLAMDRTEWFKPVQCHLSHVNFSSHVTMATNKFLNRIVIPEDVDYERESSDIASDLHAYTYGITSDPLTQFAIVL